MQLSPRILPLDVPLTRLVRWQEELTEALKLRPELDGLLHLGLKSRSVEDCFKEMDLDGDGAIQYEEFKFFCDKSASSPAIVFASIDADGDGNLTLVSPSSAQGNWWCAARGNCFCAVIVAGGTGGRTEASAGARRPPAPWTESPQP